MMTMVLVLKPGVKIVIRNLATLESMKDTYKPVIAQGQRMPCLQEGLQISRKTVHSHGCSSQREPQDDL